MPVSNFFNQVTRKAGQVWGQADRALGGWLPGGGTPSPISSARERVNQGVVTSALNSLPDRVNLFGRYMTGVGNRNLQLDSSTLADLRDATRQEEAYTKETETEGLGRGLSIIPKFGPYLPQGGPISPYFDAPKSVTNTLGRFTAITDPGRNRLRFIDKYDMVNEVEDPDLVSGKIQPVKAFNEIESIWNPAASFRNHKLNLPPGVSFNPPSKPYGLDNIQKGFQVNERSSTFSPATRFARALMYLTPVKPESYEIDVTVPYTGDIR